MEKGPQSQPRNFGDFEAKPIYLKFHFFESVHTLSEVKLCRSCESFVERGVVDADDGGREERISDERWTLTKSESLAPNSNDAEQGELGCQ
jgi:hypothetical protein